MQPFVLGRTAWVEAFFPFYVILRLRDNQALVVFPTSTLLGIDDRGLSVAHANLFIRQDYLTYLEYSFQSKSHPTFSILRCLDFQRWQIPI